MEDFYSMYVIIGLSLFLLWFFFGKGTGKSAPTKSRPHADKNSPKDEVYTESREDRVRRRLKARF